MAANRSIYIIDASVILKWFLEEGKFQTEALALQYDFFDKKITLEIPHYALAEILNTLGRSLSQEKALAVFRMILTYRITEHHITLEIASLAIELMKKFAGISFYDAGYHALALEQGATFITADEKYFRRTHKEGRIMLLKDYARKQ